MQTSPLFARRSLLGAAAASLAGTALGVRAQSPAGGGWPAKPITVVVPFPAGGGTDAFARPFSAQFAKQTGKQLIVDNRGGAGGTLGATIAARAPADGYTVFMGGIHHAIAPSVYPKLDYDLQRDFVPLALLAEVPQVLVVNPQRVTAPDFKVFLEHLKKNPAKLNYGSAGGGTSHHLAGELFKQQTGTFITHIPYRGAGPALQDLIAGNVDMMFDGLGSSAGHIKGGRIKALMVAGPKRNPSFPDVPCAAEVGLPNYNVTTWYGLWAPKGTPADMQARMVEEVKRAGAADEIKTAWAANGATYGTLTPAQFGDYVNAEIARWAGVVKSANIKLD
ncbi:tripartite tricarboxylate transporter substrate binding protein [uncultured Xylophilus sp.]|uniref:Bug family tripartite tricarboxylate transporter substrate binding protein n=1 Tax=uncultured Xylophilus sp. TaxID=296832 RepID=UPI0025D7329D|nr:tripartite tricarboxylate transporter substrate binding protein [uncultured Xylophilus sp.]